MTPEIEKLRASLDALGWIVSYMRLRLVDDPAWDEPSDASYLSARDREDPDIMANVEAMAATNALIAWFGRDVEGFVGLWRGPDDTGLANAPVVRLDKEGQYRIAGATVADYLLIEAGDERASEARELLTKLGFAPPASRKAAFKAIDRSKPEQVNDYRRELYNAGRVKRGLAPLKKRY